MPRTFKPWTPATAELELLHECWLGRLPPARIAVMSQFEFQLSTLCGSSIYRCYAPITVVRSMK